MSIPLEPIFYLVIGSLFAALLDFFKDGWNKKKEKEEGDKHRQAITRKAKEYEKIVQNNLSRYPYLLSQPHSHEWKVQIRNAPRNSFEELFLEVTPDERDNEVHSLRNRLHVLQVNIRECVLSPEEQRSIFSLELEYAHSYSFINYWASQTEDSGIESELTDLLNKIDQNVRKIDPVNTYETYQEMGAILRLGSEDDKRKLGIFVTEQTSRADIHELYSTTRKKPKERRISEEPAPSYIPEPRETRSFIIELIRLLESKPSKPELSRKTAFLQVAYLAYSSKKRLHIREIARTLDKTQKRIHPLNVSQSADYLEDIGLVRSTRPFETIEGYTVQLRKLEPTSTLNELKSLVRSWKKVNPSLEDYNIF